MRILLITDHYNPLGGTESYFFELKTRLEMHSDLDIYSMGFGKQAVKTQQTLVLKAPRFSLTKLLWRFVLQPFVYLKLRRWLDQIKPDVIHIHNIKRCSISVLKAIKPYPVVQTLHDFSLLCPTAQNLHRDNQPCPTGIKRSCFWQHHTKYNRLIYCLLAILLYQMRNRIKKIVNIFISPSPILTDYLQKNHYENVVTILPFKQEKNLYTFENMQSHQFLFAGNLGIHKGVYILINEFAIACKKNKALKLIIAGTGPEQNKLQKQVKLMRLQKNIIFLGWQPHLVSLYDTSTAVIFPSIGMESFGLVISEAMSHARPIIGANRGTTAWLVNDQHTGLLFDPLKKGDLAEKILALAADRELAINLGKNAFRKLQNLIDNSEVLDRIIEVYRRIGKV